MCRSGLLRVCLRLAALPWAYPGTKRESADCPKLEQGAPLLLLFKNIHLRTFGNIESQKSTMLLERVGCVVNRAVRQDNDNKEIEIGCRPT